MVALEWIHCGLLALVAAGLLVHEIVPELVHAQKMCLCGMAVLHGLCEKMLGFVRKCVDGS